LELNAQPGTLVCAIGEEGLFSALAASGFILTERSPDYVVVGLDRSLDLYRLGPAIKAIRNGACFIATNGDPVIVTERGFEPGTGSIVAAVASETDQKPIVIGKPSHWLFELNISRLAACTRTRVAMVGDDIETDVKGAQSLGLITALVLAGKTSRSTLEPSGTVPDYVFDDLNHLRKVWFS
jgi:4-nitrophenyl phosphatase